MNAIVALSFHSNCMVCCTIPSCALLCYSIFCNTFVCCMYSMLVCACGAETVPVGPELDERGGLGDGWLPGCPAGQEGLRHGQRGNFSS